MAVLERTRPSDPKTPAEELWRHAELAIRRLVGSTWGPTTNHVAHMMARHLPESQDMLRKWLDRLSQEKKSALGIKPARRTNDTDEDVDVLPEACANPDVEVARVVDEYLASLAAPMRRIPVSQKD